MTENAVEDYGWATAAAPHACSYVAPKVLAILKALDVKRILDLASGNGALCNQLATAGYDVVGLEQDRRGVGIARARNPGIIFYNLGVQSDPADLLAHEQQFDAVVSTEVI